MKKMRNTFRLFVTLLLLGGWALAASALHVVWTGNKAVVIPKNRIGVRETYVNTVAWSAGHFQTAYPFFPRYGMSGLFARS